MAVLANTSKYYKLDFQLLNIVSFAYLEITRTPIIWLTGKKEITRTPIILLTGTVIPFSIKIYLY